MPVPLGLVENQGNYIKIRGKSRPKIKSLQKEKNPGFHQGFLYRFLEL